MRATIPDEIKEAHWIAQERQDILARAKREAEQIAAQTRGTPDPTRLLR